MRRPIQCVVLLLATFPIIAGCSHAAREQRMSRAPEYTPTRQTAPVPPATYVPPGTEVPPGTPVSPGSEVVPVPGHPAIRASGIIDSFDNTTGVLTFRDGRMVQLIPESVITIPAGAPRELSPGLSVVAHNVLPVDGPTGATNPPVVGGTYQVQRRGTVQSVDRVNEVVRLTDGASIHSLQMSPQASVRMGVNGTPVGIQAVHPGDEIVYVVSDPSSPDADITELIILRPATQ